MNGCQPHIRTPLNGVLINPIKNTPDQTTAALLKNKSFFNVIALIALAPRDPLTQMFTKCLTDF